MDDTTPWDWAEQNFAAVNLRHRRRRRRWVQAAATIAAQTDFPLADRWASRAEASAAAIATAAEIAVLGAYPQ